MPIIVEDEDKIIDVIYERICGYKLSEAVQILEKYRTKQLIPVEFIKEQIAKTTDINDEDEFDVLYAGNLGYLLKLWEKENENL